MIEAIDQVFEIGRWVLLLTEWMPWVSILGRSLIDRIENTDLSTFIMVMARRCQHAQISYIREIRSICINARHRVWSLGVVYKYFLRRHALSQFFVSLVRSVITNFTGRGSLLIHLLFESPPFVWILVACDGHLFLLGRFNLIWVFLSFGGWHLLFLISFIFIQ